MRDFDFLFGKWVVQHRRLKSRLTGNTVWETFSGTCEAQSLLGGAGNVDDNVLELPAGTYTAATIRVFDPAMRRWSIWWIDSRTASMDTPVHGSFTAGVGTFYGENKRRGERVKVRYLWSHITANSAQWEQAFSPDREASWETNWTMSFARRT